MPPARSLADDIRGRSDDELRALLLVRPDLARPAPGDLTSLAARASTRASVHRALDELDLAHIHVLEAALVAATPRGVDLARAAALMACDVGELTAYLDRLWDAALMWRDGAQRHIPGPVAEAFAPYVAGLAPPSETPLSARARRRLAAVMSADGHERAVLTRLAWGPPLGRIDPDGDLAAMTSSLVNDGLLKTVGPGEVIIDREVALALRGGVLHRDPSLLAPELDVRWYDAADVQRAAAGQASDLLGLIDEVVAWWGARPPGVLRAGGLAARDLDRLARHLDVEPQRAAFVVEVAFAGGLVDDDGALDPVWAPTAEYDEWAALPSGRRWAVLAAAWLGSPRAAHLALTRPVPTSDGRPGPAINALSEGVVWSPMRRDRRAVLGELAGLDGAGSAADAGATKAGAEHAGADRAGAPSVESVVALLAWRRPSRPVAALRTVVAAVLQEAEWLGVTGRGALSEAGRAVLAGDLDAAATSADLHLPAAVSTVYLQADLTAIAPGRLDHAPASLLRLLADVESRGGASVFRFSEASVRRAFDHGWTADEVVRALADISAAQVPQPLSYLVADVARRHGSTRVGAATAYVRGDDPAVLDTMLADSALNHLRLRRLAPTVLVSAVMPSGVVEALREHGYAPLVEADDGGVVIATPSSRRITRARRTASADFVGARGLSEHEAQGLVSALRAGETRHAQEVDERLIVGDVPTTDPVVTLGVLREAIAAGVPVWLALVASDGSRSRALLHPTRVEGGRVFGTMDQSPQPVSLGLHRIGGAQLADQDEA